LFFANPRKIINPLNFDKKIEIKAIQDDVDL